MKFVENLENTSHEYQYNLQIIKKQHIDIEPTFFVSTRLEKLVNGEVKGKILDGIPSGGRSATFPDYNYKFGDKTYLLDVKGIGLVKNTEFFGGKKGLIYNAVFMSRPVGAQGMMKALLALDRSRECHFDGNGFKFRHGDNFYIAPVVAVVPLPENYMEKIKSLTLEKFPEYIIGHTEFFQEKRLLPSTIRMSSPKLTKLVNSLQKSNLNKFIKNFVNTSLGLFLLPVSSFNKYYYEFKYPHSYYKFRYTYDYTDSSPCADAVVDKNGICHFVDLEELTTVSNIDWKEKMGEINREIANTLFPEILDVIKMVRKRKDGKEPKKEECIEELIEILENVENKYVRFKGKPGEKIQVTIKNPMFFNESYSLIHKLRNLVE